VTRPADPDFVAEELAVAVVVLPGWRIHFDGVTYESGQTAVLPSSTALEWTCWGSVARDAGYQWPGRKRRTLRT
jgi:hypothetical protein